MGISILNNFVLPMFVDELETMGWKLFFDMAFKQSLASCGTLTSS